MHVHIAGTGSYLPEKILTNDDIAKALPTTNDEWIYSHTGIHSRHVAADDENTSDMAIKASRLALDAAGVKPEELGLVLVATSTPDYFTYPPVSCIVQGALGATQAGAFDLAAACAGFVYGLSVASSMMEALRKPILLVGAELFSRTLDFTDRNTCILFGDGAGAMVLTPSDKEEGVLDSILGSEGSAVPPIIYHTGGTRRFENDLPQGRLSMNGRATFQFAVKTCADVITRLLDRAGKAFEDLKLVVTHQANARIIEAIARRLDKPMDKFLLNMETIGNTSAASVIIAFDEAIRTNRLQHGDLVVTVAFGAGLEYAGALIRW
jgi:3-oxoacyl-[acyl-carrier-protein] synthase-3